MAHVATLSDIECVSKIKILGITITNHLSVTEHVHQVISKSAQTMHALKVVRSHGMNCEALRAEYKAVVIARLTHTAPAWRGFTSADDRKRLEAFIQRTVRLGLDKDDEPTLTQLVDRLEDSLFRVIMCHDDHVTYHLLPPVVSNTYNLRQRRHQRQLTVKSDERNCVIRKLHQDTH